MALIKTKWRDRARLTINLGAAAFLLEVAVGAKHGAAWEAKDWQGLAIFAALGGFYGVRAFLLVRRMTRPRRDTAPLAVPLPPSAAAVGSVQALTAKLEGVNENLSSLKDGIYRGLFDFGALVFTLIVVGQAALYLVTKILAVFGAEA